MSEQATGFVAAVRRFADECLQEVRTKYKPSNEFEGTAMIAIQKAGRWARDDETRRVALRAIWLLLEFEQRRNPSDAVVGEALPER